MKPRTLVITGATRGCGRALVEAFAALGHTVAGCGRSLDGVERLRRAFPGLHRFDVVDVAQYDDVRAWAEAVLAGLGAPDLLLNNAAIVNPNAPLWQVAAADFDAVVNVNLKGVANVIRHFVPGMLGRGSGVIVNFSSGWGRTTDAEVAPYCATKWAVEGLTQALAQELPAGLAAVALNPGIIDTDMLRSCFGEEAGGYPGPGEWAQAAVPFLLGLGPSDNGKPLTVPSAGA